MPAFAVLEPPGHHSLASEHGDRFTFLREKFSLGAFLFGPLWMAWQRLWIALIIYLVAVGFIEYGLHAFGIGWFVLTVVFALIQLLIGLEATALLRWTRVRSGWHDCGTVIADDLETAERRFFDNRAAIRAASGPVPVPASAQGPTAQVGQSGPEIIGLFPAPGGSR
ncbi:MAG TPA: DUF2628 domain-containing protein [Xanthobacteraceae bacterium]|nr:DUF2628 domain-containing protein [Xanthobacteraceae bacterium]